VPTGKTLSGSAAPLVSLQVPADCWRSVSMDFIFELPPDGQGHTGILVFVWRLLNPSAVEGHKMRPSGIYWAICKTRYESTP